MAYLKINGILCDSQYGFGEKHSIEHTLTDIVNQAQSRFKLIKEWFLVVYSLI